jgi:hypothetical protein
MQEVYGKERIVLCSYESSSAPAACPMRYLMS